MMRRDRPFSVHSATSPSDAVQSTRFGDHVDITYHYVPSLGDPAGSRSLPKYNYNIFSDGLDWSYPTAFGLDRLLVKAMDGNVCTLELYFL